MSANVNSSDSLYSFSPSCPWCRRNSLRRWLLPFDSQHDCQRPRQPPPTHSSHTSFQAATQINDNGENRGQTSCCSILVDLQLSFFTGYTPADKGSDPYFCHRGNHFFMQWMSWLLLGGFTFSFIKNHNHLFSSLNNLSASNDVSMHFQGRVAERYSSVPFFFKSNCFSICLHPINLKFTSDFIISSTLILSARTSKSIPLDGSESTFPAIPNHFLISIFKISCKYIFLNFIEMFRPITPETGDKDVF